MHMNNITYPILKKLYIRNNTSLVSSFKIFPCYSYPPAEGLKTFDGNIYYVPIVRSVRIIEQKIATERCSLVCIGNNV